MASSSSRSPVEYPHIFIGGAWVAPSDDGVFDSIDPATGRPWACVAYEARLLATVPLGRPCRAEEPAHAALWLASDDAAFVTGVALPVDAGFTAR